MLVGARYCLLVFLLGIGLLPPSSMALTRWKLWITQPPGHPATLASQQFADLVNTQYKVQYRLDVYPNAVLGDTYKAIRMLQSGQLAFAQISLGPISERVPSLQLLKLPFLFRGDLHLQDTMNGPLGQRYRDEMQAAGLVVLDWYPGGSRSFYCAGSAVRSLRDLADKRIRAPAQMQIAMVKHLGAIPLAVPYAEVGSALASGNIDCAENNIISFVEGKHYLAAKTWLDTNHMVAPEALVVSRKIWDKLSKSEKAQLRSASSRAAHYMTSLWQAKVNEAMQTAQQQGVQLITPDDLSSGIKQMEPLYRSVLNTPSARADLAEILKQ